MRLASSHLTSNYDRDILSQPYCGLYCLYTAMKLVGRKVDFRELVKPEYFVSDKG